MILVDTSVLVYTVGDGHPLRAPCRRLIELVADGSVRAHTTVEVIQELVHVRGRRRGRHDAASLGRAYSTLLAPLVQPAAAELAAGLTLFEEHAGLGAFDAVLAATALRAADGFLVSADSAFAEVDGLHLLDPAAENFERVLLDVAG